MGWLVPYERPLCGEIPDSLSFFELVRDQKKKQTREADASLANYFPIEPKEKSCYCGIVIIPP